jgi:hypothetical protein
MVSNLNPRICPCIASSLKNDQIQKLKSNRVIIKIYVRHHTKNIHIFTNNDVLKKETIFFLKKKYINVYQKWLRIIEKKLNFFLKKKYIFFKKDHITKKYK